MRYKVKKAVDVLKLACKVDKPYIPRVIALDYGILVKGQSLEALVPFETGIINQLEFTHQAIEKLACNDNITQEQFVEAGNEVNEEPFYYWEPNYNKTLDAKGLKKALDVLKPGMSKDDARPILKGMLIDDNKLVAIDGYRILTRDLDDYLGFKEVIPPQAVEILSKLIGKNAQGIDIQADNGYVNFKLDDLELRFGLLHGEFLNYGRVFDTDNEIVLKVNRKELLDAVNDLAKVPFYEKYDDGTEKKLTDKIDISRKRPLVISFEDSLIGLSLDVSLSLHHEENISSRVIGAEILHGVGKAIKELKIAFNPWYLSEALKVAYDDEEVEIHLISNLCPMTIVGNCSKCLVLPIRIN